MSGQQPVTTWPWPPTPDNRASSPWYLTVIRLSSIPEHAQYGRVQIVYAHRLFYRRIAQLIAGAIRDAAA